MPSSEPSPLLYSTDVDEIATIWKVGFLNSGKTCYDYTNQSFHFHSRTPFASYSLPNLLLQVHPLVSHLGLQFRNSN